MACDCVTNALREHPDCYDHTNECVADRVEAAEAKGYARALEGLEDVPHLLKELRYQSLHGNPAYLARIDAALAALKKKVPDEEVTILQTETYRALVKSFRETVARLEGEASYHEQDGRPSVASQIFGWCAEAEASLALLREVDTGEAL
jgi:hypothetical protein